MEETGIAAWQEAITPREGRLRFGGLEFNVR